MSRILKSWPKRKIIIDTREQLPWAFPTELVVRQSLGTGGGDYSLLGLESVVRIERKSTQDLVGSLSGKRKDDVSGARAPRDKLKDEFKWLGENVRWAFMIFEGSWETIAAWNYRGGINPSSIIGSLVSWSMRFGVHVIPAGDRKHAFGMANRILRKAEELHEEEAKEGGHGT